MSLPHEQRKRLIDLLLRVPATQTFEGRTTLLGGAGSGWNRNQGSARLDLELIVLQLLDLKEHRLLTEVIENAVPYVEGTEVARELETLRQLVVAKPAGGEPGRPGGDGEPKGPVRVFISYADKDKGLLDDLVEQLANLEKRGRIRVWHRGKVPPGHNTEQTVRRELDAAQVLVLLVTASYNASRFEEAEQAVKRHDAGRARVIPVRARACLWAGAPFEKMEALPRGDKAVASQSVKEEAWEEVVSGIHEAIKGAHA